MGDEGWWFHRGRCPFKLDGKSCFARRRMSPQRFAVFVEKGEREGERERSRVPENYGGRGKRTRAIYVEHSCAARFCCSLITREKEQDGKGSARIGREIIVMRDTCSPCDVAI